MRLYLYAAVALAVLIPVAMFIWWLLGVLINKPEGTHHKPTARQAERDEDAKNLKLLQGISSSLRGEATRAITPRMPRAEWPLQPLPEGVEEYADHFHRPVPPEVDDALSRLTASKLELVAAQTCTQCGEHYGDDPECECRCTRAIADPVDVATPEQVADAYVAHRAATLLLRGDPDPLAVLGDDAHADELVGLAGLTGPQAAASLPSPAPEPEPAPLTDFREQTGSWEALVDAVIPPKDGAR